MGQKINPTGLRIGVIKDWESRWYADKATFGDTLVTDYNVREYLLSALASAGVPKIEIERDPKRVRINIHCAKPGMVIGKGGAEIARSETYKEGTIPLQTIRADIDYGFTEAKTTYGRIGVKVWIYRGEVLHEAASNNNNRRQRRDRRA